MIRGVDEGRSLLFFPSLQNDAAGRGTWSYSWVGTIKFTPLRVVVSASTGRISRECTSPAAVRPFRDGMAAVSARVLRVVPADPS